LDSLFYCDVITGQRNNLTLVIYFSARRAFVVDNFTSD